MPYVTRDISRAITAVYQEPRVDAMEWLETDDAELVNFIAGSVQVKDLLSELDADMARVIEDLIDLLIAKKVILPTDLPDVVQQKLAGRQQLRQQLTGFNPVVDEGDII